MGTHKICFYKESVCFGYSFELHRQIDAIQMGTLNICLFKEVDKNYTGCNLKTRELLDCGLIWVCAIIRLNMVCCEYSLDLHENISCGYSLEVPQLWCF